MSKSTLHAYEITYSDFGEDTGAVVGAVMLRNHHYRAHHEPERVWEFLSMTGEVRSISATHIGEWEKVEKYVIEWRRAQERREEGAS